MVDFTKLSTSIPFLGILASAGLFYQHIKSFLVKIFRFFIKKRLVNMDFSETFYFELKKKSWIVKLDEYELRYQNLFHKKENCYLPTLFKSYGTEIFLYKYFIPIILKGHEGKEFSISYLKGFFPFEQYIDNVIKIYQNKIALDRNITVDFVDYGRFRVEMISGSSLKAGFNKNKGQELEEQQLKSSNEAPATSSMENGSSGLFRIQECLNRKMRDRFFGINEIELYSVCSNITQEKNKYQFTKQGKYVLDQVGKWLKCKKWYEERNILWRRGICLHGKTGTGKSSLILEIAKKFGVPIYVFNLASMDDDEFSKKLNRLERDSGIILFEDIDAIFNLRENLTKTSNFGGLNFEHFINQLSGVNSIQNKFIFITTNHLDKLDSALIRPGRVDEIIEIVSLNLEEKRNMAHVFLNGNIGLVEKCLEIGENYSSAEFENLLTQEALKIIWT